MLTFEKRRERALLSYLDVLSNRDAVLSYQQIQGLLFAMASSPEPVRPIEWFELIWLNDDPQFDDAGEAKAFFGLLLELSRHIDEEARGERYRPGLDAQGRISAVAMADWCDGFLLGHQYLEDVWQIALEDLDDDQLFDKIDDVLNTAIAFAAGEYEAEGAEEALLAERLQFQELLDVYHSVQARWSGAKRPWDVYECYEQLASVEREALCPCGSGRTFGQCCLH